MNDTLRIGFLVCRSSGLEEADKESYALSYLSAE
jgi:hypothetical protein